MQKKKICLLLLGSMVLAGCTMQTPEIRQDQKQSELDFDALRSGEGAAKEQTKTEAKTETTPVVQNNTLTNKKMYTTPPQMTIDVKKQYTATFKTSAGDIVVDLTAAATPITVNNFVFLAREKFYDGTIFHRTINGFMIQGGDPQGTGMGDPGYKFNDEPFAGEYTRGTVAMANSGANTNGSQFFIMHKDNALPKNYVIFGHVVSGLEVVDTIATAPTKPGGEGSSPVTPVTVTNVTISEK